VKPSVFKAEAPAFRDFCGGKEQEGNMVERKMSERGEARVRELLVPEEIDDEASIQEDNSGFLSSAAPRVGSVK
jgi:hypothetical protein